MMKLQEPPSWTALAEWIGRGSIFFAAAVLTLAALCWLFQPKKEVLGKVGGWLFLTGCLGFFVAIGTLGTLFFREQFQFAYVFAHSDLGLSPWYKLAAIWSGQEGSFLLWGACASFWGILVAPKTAHYRRWFTVVYAAFLVGLAGILSYESPFRTELLEGRFMPPNGNGLNPTLMNYWVVIHPPTIFFGFGALTVLFAWACAAVWTGDRTSWVPLIRPWNIVCSTLLGIGLVMGGFWAYETLGWGGFWAWDPVENQSLVTWVWTVALLHGLYLQAARAKWVNANTFLAGTSLITFLYGTYLTRSGVMKDTSVHSFAEMNSTALLMLIGLCGIFTGGFLLSWGISVWKHRKESQPARAPAEFPIHRQSAMTLAVWLLLFIGLAAGIGMSVPFFRYLQGQEAAIVEEPIYNRLSAILIVPLLLALAVAPLVSWRGMPFRALANRVVTILAASFALLAAIMAWMKFGVNNLYKPEPGMTAQSILPQLSVPHAPVILVMIWLCLFTACANFAKIVEMARKSRGGVGAFLTHFGIVVMLLGLIASKGFQKKEEALVQAGNPGFALGHVIELGNNQGRNFLARENPVDFQFKSLDGNNFKASPILFYTFRNGNPEPSPTVRPYVINKGLYDLYVAIYPMVFDAGEPVTLKPGQSYVLDEYEITYKGFERKGEAGMLGTTFIAKLDVRGPNGTVQLGPALRIGADRPEFLRAEADTFTISMDRMDAATQSVTLSFFYKNPLYPLDVYYKPLTILVWGGAGIMTIGGFWAALARRIAKKKTPSEPPSSDSVEDKEPNAALTTA